MPAPVEVQVLTTLDSNALNRTGQRISRSLGTVAKDFDQNLQRAEKRILSFTSVAGVIYTVQKGFTELVKSTIEVEKSLTDINVIVNTSQRELKKFGDSLFDVAKDTNQSFATVAKAAVELSRQGLSLQETLRRTKDALILTQLSGIDAGDAVSTLTATINSFNKSMLTSTDIVNKFAAVDAKFAVSSADLAEAVRRVGSSAQEAGVNLDQLIAIVTSAQQTTARGGAVIGNALKTIFQKVERPETLTQLENLRITVRDSNGEMLSGIQIVNNLAAAYDGLSQSNKSQVAEMVGGIYQVNILKGLLRDLSSGAGSAYQNAFNTAVNAGDVAIQRSEELNQSLSAIINRTKLNLGQLGSSIGGSTLSPFLKSNLGVVNDLLENLNKPAEDGGEEIGRHILVGIGNTLLNQGTVVLAAYLTKITRDLAIAASGALTGAGSIRGILPAATKVPGFANPVRAAIYREAQSGVPSSSIRVGSHPMLASGNNPSGLGVYNTIDEPRGLGQGINRAISQGINPRNHGIPNFAFGQFSGSPYGPAGSFSSGSYGMNYPSGYAGSFAGGMYGGGYPGSAIPLNIDPTLNPGYSNGGGTLGSRAAFLTQQYQASQPSYFARANDWIGRNIGARPGVALGLTFGAPMLANTIADSIGTNSLDARRAGGLVSGAGNVISAAAMGGQAFGLGGAVAGGGGMLIYELIKATKEWNNSLPELISKLEDAKKKTSDLEAGFLTYIRSSDILKDKNISLSRSQMIRLQNDQTSGLSKFTPEEQARIQAAYINGGGVAGNDKFSEINTPYANEQIIAGLATFGSKLSQKRNSLFKDTNYGLGNASEWYDPGMITGRGSNGRELNKEGQTAMEGLRSFVGSVTDTQGQGIQGLLTKDEGLRSAVFAQVEKGTEEGALSGLKIAFAGLGQGDRIKGLVDAIDQQGPEIKEAFLKSLFTGNLSRSGLAELAKGGRTAQRLQTSRNQEYADSINFGLRNTTYMTQNSMGALGDIAASNVAHEGVLDVLRARTEGSSNVYKSNAELGLARISGRLSSADIQRIQLSNQGDQQRLDYADSLNLIGATFGEKRRGANSGLGSGIISSFNSVMNPYVTNESLEGAKYGNDRGQIAAGKVQGYQKLIDQYNQAASLNDTTGMGTAYKKINTKLGADIFGLSTSKKNEDIEYSKKLNDFREQLIKLEEERKNNLKAINEGEIGALSVAEIQNKYKEKLLVLSEKILHANQQNEAIFNTGAADREILNNAGVSQGKFDYVGGKYISGMLGTAELEAARGGGIEGYRGAYGVNGRLEAANAYAGFKNQFNYGAVDQMREMEKAAVDLGATMKNSFADAFKAFSMGTQSAGQAFKSFGMGILDKITSITSNIATNLLFSGIGSLLPTSNFGSILSNAIGHSSGGLITGGSGIRDDVPKMLSPGDYVLQKSAVNKYGVSFASSLNNSYDYNDPKHPTSGSFNIDSRLSSFALEDENNPQNALRNSREQGLMSYIKEKEQYDSQKAAAMRQYRNAQNQRLIGAYISAGIMVGGAGIKSAGFGGGRDSFGGRIPAGGYSYPNTGWSGQGFNQYSQPGSSASLGVGYAVGGAVGGGSSRGDTVPAMLMGGEFVVSRDAVNRIGVPTLNMINAGRYATGGVVLPGPNTQVGNQGGMQDSILALLQSINLLKQTIDKPSGQNSGISKTDAGINYYSNISINLNKTGEPTVQSETRSTGGDKNNDKDNVEALKKFSNMIDSKIYEAFNKESKPGGLLRNILAA